MQRVDRKAAFATREKAGKFYPVGQLENGQVVLSIIALIREQAVIKAPSFGKRGDIVFDAVLDFCGCERAHTASTPSKPPDVLQTGVCAEKVPKAAIGS